MVSIVNSLVCPIRDIIRESHYSVPLHSTMESICSPKAWKAVDWSPVSARVKTCTGLLRNLSWRNFLNFFKYELRNVFHQKFIGVKDVRYFWKRSPFCLKLSWSVWKKYQIFVKSHPIFVEKIQNVKNYLICVKCTKPKVLDLCESKTINRENIKSIQTLKVIVGFIKAWLPMLLLFLKDDM